MMIINNNDNNFGSLYLMKHLSFRLAVISICPVLVPLELLLSNHLPTSEGWTAELAVGLWLMVPMTGFEPTRVDLARFETLRLNHSATPSDGESLVIFCHVLGETATRSSSDMKLQEHEYK